MSDYETIIGLEVHVELDTKSKMFCGCPADHFGKEPNTQTCPVCLALPGALPVPNKKAIEWAVLLGLALDCTIPTESKFDRKNYFYPDLPKGYQISQYDMPLAREGVLKFKVQSSKFKGEEEKVIRIRRVHMEEDTGKLQHATENGERMTLVDFNRSGVSLVEIVTEPDFRSLEEADVFVKKLQRIIRYLGISGADMEKGSMRIEPSISMRQVTGDMKQETLPNYRVEIKNINSFKFARRAIEYEQERQMELLERGETPVQQTRGFVESKGITVAQRDKEEAHDYRYFPEPDIPPMRWEESQISNIKYQIAELPDVKKVRFMKEYGLSEYDADQLTETHERADYFEKAISTRHDPGNQMIELDQVTPKMIANVIINKKVDIQTLSPADLVTQLIASSQQGSMDGNQLHAIIQRILTANQKAIDDYKKGKEQVLMFLVGQVMREAKGQCSAATVKIQLIEMIKK